MSLNWKPSLESLETRETPAALNVGLGKMVVANMVVLPPTTVTTPAPTPTVPPPAPTPGPVVVVVVTPPVGPWMP